MPTYQHLTVSEYDDVMVVRFRGQHLIVSQWIVNKIGSELDEVADRPGCRKLVVDFFGVVDLSSFMLGLVVMLRKKMASKKGHLVLCGLSPEVREFFDETMLSQILDIRESETDAFAALV